MSNTRNILHKSNFIEKFRFFFRYITWKKSQTFLFFLLLAIIFWGMRVYTQRIEIRLTIPLKYTNVANDILFENDLPTHINIHIKDLGSAILKYANRSKDSLEIDLGAIMKESTTRTVLQGQAYEQLIKTKILPSSEVVSFYPISISYAYNKVAIKKLPVLFDGHTNLAPGYQLDGDITFSPDTVLAYGSQTALDTIGFAYTVRDTINEIKGSQKIEVALKETRGIDYRTKYITLDIPVDKFLLKELKVVVECANLPDDLAIRFFPPEVTVPFFVGLKRYNLIDSKDFKIVVDYEDIKDLQDSSIPIRIIESPDFVRTRLPEPSEVEFILEQK